MNFLNIPEQMWEWTQPPAIRHPGALRAFQDIRVLKLLDALRKIKKISSPYTGQHQEHAVQSVPSQFLLF